MKIGMFVILFIFGVLRCRNGLIIKVLIIPYFSLLVANFQNWLSVLFLDEGLLLSFHISINGYKISDLYFLDLFRFIRTVPNAFDQFKFFLEENNLFLFSLNKGLCRDI